MAEKPMLSSMTDEELFVWFQQNKQSLIPSDQQKRLEEFDRDILRQKLAISDGELQAEAYHRRLAELAKESPQPPDHMKFDASKFHRRQKQLADQLNANDAWVSFDDFGVLCDWDVDGVEKNAAGLIQRFNATAEATGQPARVVRHNSGFRTEATKKSSNTGVIRWECGGRFSV